MLPLIGLPRQLAVQATFEQAALDSVDVRPLIKGQEAEALEFLAAQPVHNVYMAGFIRDNGLVSPLNRGTFYGCRHGSDPLEGIALIGHVTQLDVRTARAMKAFAGIAQTCPTVHVVLGERSSVHDFWSHYSDGGQEMRVACRELLLEQKLPIEVSEPRDCVQQPLTIFR